MAGWGRDDRETDEVQDRDGARRGGLYRIVTLAAIIWAVFRVPWPADQLQWPGVQSRRRQYVFFVAGPIPLAAK